MESLFEYQSQNSGKHWPMTLSQSNNEIVLGENGTHILSGHLLDPKGCILSIASSGSSDQMGHKAWSLIRWSAPGNMTPLQIMLLLWW